MDGLHASLIAGAVGALAGVFSGCLALLGTDLSGAAREGDPTAPLDQRLAIGAFLLSSHAIAVAAIWQLPQVGACIAAGLGAGWMGAAAAGAIGLLSQPERVWLRVTHIVVRLCIGAALLAPLWTYMRLMQMQAMGAMHA
ncbi:MAG: hypothetical protein K1X35_08440 [Caulobacteraceae bacterium]|nr:hypothetical protein [Caulobacteraceae bacterium]